MNLDALVSRGRQLQGETFLDTATVYDRTFAVVDELGGKAETWTARTATLACRIVQAHDSVLEGRDGVMQQAGLKFLNCAVGEDLDEGDRVEVNGVTYEIVASYTTNSTTSVVDRYRIREV